jgi:signal transduction histidine kinase
MTGNFFLDWATMAVSLFNTILLLWLGLTVLLNAERRTWGVWLAGGGMLMGGAFFVSHSAILGHGLHYTSRGMDFWWRMGWVPVVALPFAWYVVMLWYAGFWDDRQAHLYHRQRLWFLLTALLTLGLIGLLGFANPLPSYSQVVQLNLSATPSVGGIPLLILVYPLYITLCISLSLDALRRPEPSGRVMGDLARRRARPWLVATSIVLLLISLLVAWIMLWIVLKARQRALYGVYTDMALTVAWFDLIIAFLIAIVIILLGRAVVSYEVFTGKPLPRRGFFRHWRSTVILAAGYSVVVAWSLAIQLRLIYSLMLATMLMTVFYALFSWRTYAERESFMVRLRPFVASQRLYDRLLAHKPLDEGATRDLFHTICRDVLGTRRAYLVPMGRLVVLTGPPLVYGQRGQPTSLPPTSELALLFPSPETRCVPLDPIRYAGASWAVSLWNDQGLAGTLLLGEKQDGGFYAQEEIEIAQASGERLLDVLAGAEMSRMVMGLLRRRIAEVKVLGGQRRRILHDEVLPQLHTAILQLEGSADGDEGPSRERPYCGTGRPRATIKTLTAVHRQLSALIRSIPTAAPHHLARHGLVAALRNLVQDDFGGDFEEITWQADPEAVAAAEDIPLFMSEAIFYAVQEAIRNAARHGRGDDPKRTLHLNVSVKWQEGLCIAIQDNGIGLSVPDSLANEHPSGSGSGLRFHSAMLAVIGANLEVESQKEQGTRVTISLPQATLSATGGHYMAQFITLDKTKEGK